MCSYTARAIKMDEEDRRIAKSQVTGYNVFLSGFHETGPYFTLVAVPPKAPDTKEKWIGVNPRDGSIKMDIRQPDPERNVICGNNDNGCLCYWYADELPCCTVLAVVSAVILSILTTPLILLCCVPMIQRMIKVRLP